MKMVNHYLQMNTDDFKQNIAINNPLEQFKKNRINMKSQGRTRMPKIITLESFNTVQFYQILQAFYHNPKYYGMNPSSRETYAMLHNLLPLSINNGWVDEEGEIYVKLSREKLMLRLGIGKDKMVKVFKELRALGLIVEKRIGCNKCNEIYICEAEDFNEIYSDEELLNLLEEDEEENGKPEASRSSVKQKSEPLKK